ncbi:regulatory protein [Salmonella enterica subsp. arizonae]|uniref:Regulatory protein n=1 Tax=Salmonella enterica subsp. arizonae TaxID=59203 RepID=A0A2X4TWF5_SALER|nr:regulatory protein [Salmonella enterica subsp. arizonae]
MNSRQQSILQMVVDKGQMSVAELAKITGVSEVTIRQDLNTLEKQKLFTPCARFRRFARERRRRDPHDD